MAHRFFLTAMLDPEPGRPAPLSEADVHHAVRVLRVRPGERVELVEPGGAVMSAEVVSADDDGVVVRAEGRIAEGEVRAPHVALFQSIAKGEKMDSIVRQAVEIGAMRIVPVTTSRTVVRLDDAKRGARRERWQRIAKSAAEQAKRSSVPEVAEPVPLRDALDRAAEYDRVVVLWEEHRGASIADVLSGLGSDARVALVIGPEGGLSAEEVEAFVSRGAVLASLGPAVLRTETAAVVSLALAMAALGGMGGGPR